MPYDAPLSIEARLLDGLDPEQRDAVLYDAGHLLTVAPAGTGKTEVLARRLALSIQRGRLTPSRTIAVTFTVDATATLRERIASLLEQGCNSTAAEDIWIGTFHSLSARILRNHAELVSLRPSFRIADEKDSEAIFLRIIPRFYPELPAVPDEFSREARRLVRLAQAMKPGMPPQNFNVTQRDMNAVIAYERELLHANAVDYGGLIAYTLLVLRKHADVRDAWRKRFDAVFCDEFADVDSCQVEWLNNLVGPRTVLSAFGDDDQSVYGWRHSEPRFILEFEQQWPAAKIITLTHSYRSSAGIVDAANRLIANNARRRPKALVSAIAATTDTPIVYQHFRVEADETAWISGAINRRRLAGDRLAEIAVLVRTNRLADPIAEQLRSLDIPYVMVGGTALDQRSEVKTALAYLRLAEDPLDEISYERVAASAPYLLSPERLDLVAATARRRGIPVRAAAIDRAGDDLSAGAPFAVLDDIEAAIARHSTDAPPATRLDALLHDPGLITAWRNTDYRRGTSLAEDSLGELRQRLAAFDSIVAYLERAPASTSPSVGENGVTCNDAVRILTCHAAKGLQWNTVFIPGWEEETFPMLGRGAFSEAAVEEERRLAYVSITRAQQQAVLTSATHRHGRYLSPSRFLAELGLPFTP